jgi:hypothetical protein
MSSFCVHPVRLDHRDCFISKIHHFIIKLKVIFILYALFIIDYPEILAYSKHCHLRKNQRLDDPNLVYER